MDIEFKPWPKIPRGLGEVVVVTEKIDGTNACIVIQDGEVAAIQSRKRFITPEDDNYGFARWVRDNEESLLALGDGHHYGEWAGPGIQKNPHNLNEKRFFLFNTLRWLSDPKIPVICDVVPVLYEGVCFDGMEGTLMDELRDGSEGKYTPEGIVIFSKTTKTMRKFTFQNVLGKWSNK